MRKSEPESTFHKRENPEKLNEKTRLLDPNRKMSSGTGYTKFRDDSIEVDKVTATKCCSCISTLCCCNFWYHVLMFILLPWAIYHYRIQIVNWFYGCWYGELPNKAVEPNLGPPVKRLQNLGNTCFFNSMNQSINQTVLLQQMLTDCFAEQRKYVIKPEQQEQLVVQVVGNTEHVDLTNEACDLYCTQIPMQLWDVVVPRGLLRELSNRNPRFGRRKEEDSHEALRCLLDGLRMEEINKIKDEVYACFGVTKDPASQVNLDGEKKLKLKVYLREAGKQCVPADTVFGGVQISTTICRECYTALQNEEKFLDMSLPLPEDQAETVGASGYRPPVIKYRDKRDVKGSSFNSKEPPEVAAESNQGAESADDTVHDKQPVDQNVAKEPIQDLVPDQAHKPVDDWDTKPSIESDHDAGSEDKPVKEDTLIIISDEVHRSDDVDHVGDEHSAPKENSKTEHEDGESAAATVDPTSQLEGEEHDNQITGVDEVSDVDVNPETVPADPEEKPSDEMPSQKEIKDQNVIDVNLSSGDHQKLKPDNDMSPETVPAEEKPFEEVLLQEKINNLDVNLSSGDNQKPKPDVALRKVELHKYLESKGLQYQMLPPESEEEKDPQTLEAILNEYTALDVLDEDNKFICKTCTDNHRKSMDNNDNDDDDDPPLSLVSKQIAVHRLPPVLILHLKRFSIEPDGIYKDTQHIKFPFKLNMAPYCTTQCIEEMGDCNQEIWYGLYAVVVHDGNTLEHGHYFAYVRRRHPTKCSAKPPGAGWMYDQAAAEGGYWFYASDLTVRFCERGFEEVRKQKAYMLFYELLPKRDYLIHTY